MKLALQSDHTSAPRLARMIEGELEELQSTESRGDRALLQAQQTADAPHSENSSASVGGEAARLHRCSVHICSEEHADPNFDEEGPMIADQVRLRIAPWRSDRRGHRAK